MTTSQAGSADTPPGHAPLGVATPAHAGQGVTGAAPAAMSHARLSAIVAALPEPVLLVAPSRMIALANHAAHELFGPDLAGTPILAHIRQPDAIAALERALSCLNRTDAVFDPLDSAFDARLTMGMHNTETVYRLTARPLSREAGLTGVLVSLHDVSHVEEAEQQRRDFVANVSHEMRSPLTVLAGFIETLRGSARDDAASRERFLDIMNREVWRMSRLVEDLLSLSRVESNERIRPRDRIKLSDVLHATLAALRPQIEDMRVAVDFRDLPSAPAIPGDHDQLVQVFHNLIENAVKYGGSGGRIEIAITRLDGAPGVPGPALRASVRDFGDGIDPIHLPRLTERFYRVDGHRSREKGGTGLGLAIVKHIVNRHRGRLVIESNRGEGSSFVVILPLN